LGTDEIYVYLIEKDSLKVYKKLKVEPGSGPRHIAFNSRMETMSVINELKGSISTFRKETDGCYSEYLNTVNALPEVSTGIIKVLIFTILRMAISLRFKSWSR
jgi:6-phosphogluconolactonase